MVIKDISQLDPKGTYTYADYLQWQFEETVELIKGRIYRMSPAPLRQHQKISGRLFTRISVFLEEKTCELYDAPFDVRLPKISVEARQIYTVVQPDLCVICDPAKLDDRGCVGAPDWVIEITSPGTLKKDFGEKYSLYEASGVREYWIVVPESQTVHVYFLKGDQYEQVAIYEKEGLVPVNIFPDLVLNATAVFA